MYKKLNNELGCKAYVWKMHNFSGNYKNDINPRKATNKKTCGRPFAEELTKSRRLSGKISCSNSLLSDTWSTE